MLFVERHEFGLNALLAVITLSPRDQLFAKQPDGEIHEKRRDGDELEYVCDAATEAWYQQEYERHAREPSFFESPVCEEARDG